METAYKEKWVSDCGRVTLYLGDCLEILPSIKKQVDAVVSDPPYGIGFQHGGGGNPGKGLCGSTVGMMKNTKTCKIYGDDKPFDPTPWTAFEKCLLFGADHFRERLPLNKGDFIAWDKRCGCGPNNSFRDVEFIWSSVKTPRNIVRHVWMGAIRAGEASSSRETRFHVSQKPVEVMFWCIETLRVKVGSTILDPFMGSGTTGVACIRTGRRFIGIEIDEGHFGIAKARIQAELAKLSEMLIPQSLESFALPKVNEVIDPVDLVDFVDKIYKTATRSY